MWNLGLQPNCEKKSDVYGFDGNNFLWDANGRVISSRTMRRKLHVWDLTARGWPTHERLPVEQRACNSGGRRKIVDRISETVCLQRVYICAANVKRSNVLFCGGSVCILR